MKKVNFNFGILALVMGVALTFVTSAFTAPAANLETSWFEYDLVGDPTQPSSYEIQPGTPSCNSTESMCSIRAEVAGDESPVIDAALELEIEDALENKASSANVKLFE